MLYLDNAATSWPKPDSVIAAVTRHLREIGATPGRSGHRLANEAERTRFEARLAVAELFGVRDPLRVIFTLNATTALNLVMRGLLTPGSHVVTSGMEHNAVMRVLRALEANAVEVSVASCATDGTLDPERVRSALRAHTRLIVINHASNVCGTLLPVRAIGTIAHEHRTPLLVDAAQTGGCVPLNLWTDQINLLAFSGHKGLLGPAGTGGLVMREDFDIERLPPLIAGGTGSLSEHEQQPGFLPDKYEAGTPNMPGLAGLAAGARWVLERSVERIQEHEQALCQKLIAGLKAIPRVGVLGTGDAKRQTATVAFNVEGVSPSELAQTLDERYAVMCRPGLHCAPLAHRSLGTLPGGAVRFSLGPFSTADDVGRAVAAVADAVGR